MTGASSARRTATIAGLGAVGFWALLALLTVWSAPVPPFQLAALSFFIGGAAGLVWLARTGAIEALRRVPFRAYAFGTLGLFGYHAAYFSALRLAPPAEAGLIAYLWPLLIVLFSGLLPGERLALPHVAGAVAGFTGAALLVLGDQGADGPTGETAGYALALLCALIWSGYSVLTRRMRSVPAAAVAVYCLATAALALAAHLVFEETRWPAEARGWFAIAGLGLGPVGLAFFLWDRGMKHGNIQLLGVSSYAAPLLSTLVLVAAGLAKTSPALLSASALITGGALVAAAPDLLRGMRAGQRLD